MDGVKPGFLSFSIQIAQIEIQNEITKTMIVHHQTNNIAIPYL